MSAGAPEEFGPYLVYEEIGVGGMASVHRAETRGIEGFSKPVALKRMLPSFAANAEFVEAFIREARIASHLRHVNVAQTYELGKVGGIYFIAMELVTGRNLRQILRHCAGLTSQMPVAVTVNILNQICDALDYAHNLCDETGTKLGIIHRDVSPSNIIVSEDGVVKLIDFGIAKASARGMQTVSGMLKGKFGYMAPEYVAGSIDARADLFALGVIAHELLTNRPLFTCQDDMETLNRVCRMPIEPPSARNRKVPEQIDELVMTALERDPDKRWQHATALRTAMTTMTKRLKLDVMNTEVAEWLDWLFDQGNGEAAMSTLQDATDVEAPEAPTMSARAATLRDSARMTTRRAAEAAEAAEDDEASEMDTMDDDRAAPPTPSARKALMRTLIGGTHAAERGSGPSIALPTETPRQASAAAITVRGSDPSLVRRPSRPSGSDGFASGSAPGTQLAGPGFPSGEVTTPLPPTARAVHHAMPTAPVGRGRGLVLILFFVFVIAAAATAVVYFAMQ